MTHTQIQITIFASITLLILGIQSLVYEVFYRYRDRVSQRVTDDLKLSETTASNDIQLFRRVGSVQESVSRGKRCQRWLSRFLEQSGTQISARRLLFVSSAFATVSSVIVFLISRSLAWSFASASIAASLLPAYVWMRYQARRAKIYRQLPYTLELINRSIRAGQTMPAAFQMVATDVEAPLGEEFACCIDQQHMGLSIEVAARGLATRTEIVELQIFAVALATHARTGGSLTELLDNLSDTVRRRLKLQMKVKAMTAEGRLQAMTLVLLPIASLIALGIFNRSYLDVLFATPSLLGLAAAAQCLGGLWIYHITRVNY